VDQIIGEREDMEMARQLPEKVEKLFLLFKAAVEDERKAQAMYKEAIGLCDDEFAKKELEGLYADEVRHERQLVERYNALRRALGVADS
jgi:rubrerythrin